MALFRLGTTDADLLAGIQAGGTQRRLYENRLYEKYAYLIRDATRKHQLSEDEAATAYSDALLSVIVQVASGHFKGRSELKTFLYQIFTNKCIDLIRKNATNRASVHRASPLDDLAVILPDDTRSALQRLMSQQDAERLHRLLHELGEKCRALLLGWGEGFSDEELAPSLSYANANVTKVSRLRCLDRLREKYRNEVKN
ncbi:MAG: RNA polymerase sigma factor [Cytophagaceae bacterium]|nr:RNA polymerase sigma factor [Cytophagaceae bacterium]